MKTYKEHLNPTFYIYVVHGPIVPHTRSGRVVSHRRRIDYVVKFLHALATEEIELGKFISLQEAGVYAHWILTNPNGYYELKDLAVDPRRTSAHVSFLWEELSGEDFRYRVVLSSVVTVPEKKEEEKVVEKPTEASSPSLESSSELKEEEVAPVISSVLGMPYETVEDNLRRQLEKNLRKLF